MTRDDHDPRVAQAADAIASGKPVDWPGLESSRPSSSSADRLLRQLKVLEQIADLSRQRSTTDRPPLGACWGSLEVLELIGHGTFGDVYRARDVRLDREVALKLLDTVTTGGSLVINEARSLARVRHPNVVVVHGADCIDDRVGIWMELVHGVTLNELVQQNGRMSAAAALSICADVSRAVEAVHAAGLVHGDVKAQNVKREPGGRVVLMDFGMAQATILFAQSVQPGGTPLYIAPELLNGAAPSVASDVYALGVLAYYLVSGAFPVEATTFDHVRAAFATGARIPIRARQPDIEEAVANVIDTATAPLPEERYRSAGALALALDTAAATCRPTSRPRRIQTAIPLAIIAVLLAGAGVARWNISSRVNTGRRLFSEAETLMHQGRSDAAEPLLREAVSDDPAFASAYVLLIQALKNQNKPSAEYASVVTNAEKLLATATEGERLFIRASALSSAGKQREACAEFEALVQIQPDHYWATSNVARCYQEAGDRFKAASFLGRLADLRPDNIDDNVVAAWANEFVVTDLPAAGRYRDRAERLQAAGAYSSVLWSNSWLRVLPAYRRWLDDDVAGAAALLDAIERDAERLAPPVRDDLLQYDGSFRMTLGQMSEAERLFRQVNNGSNVGPLAQVEYARGDRDGARQLLRGYSDPGATSSIVSARVGLPDLGKAFLAGPGGGQWCDHAVAGELALQAGDVSSALEHLQIAVLGPGVRSDGGSQYFLAAESFGEALANAGRLDEAMSAIEVAVAERNHAYEPFSGGPFAGYAWLRLRLLQAELFARSRRVTDSRQIARQIVQLLERADQDFPILIRARQLLDSP